MGELDSGRTIVTEAIASIETFERYHTVDIAAGANYVPGDEGLFSASMEGANKLKVELQDSSPAWRRVKSTG